MQNEIELQDAVLLRHHAYGRAGVYQDGFVAGLRNADGLDTGGKAVVFGAFSSASELLGTVRVTSSDEVPGLLPEVVPVDDIPGDTFTLVDRFAVAPGVDRSTATMLMKALYRWAQMKKSDCLVALAISPLVSHYERFGGLRRLGAGLPIDVASDLREPVFLVGGEVASVTATLAMSNTSLAAFYDSPLGPISLTLGTPVREASYV